MLDLARKVDRRFFILVWVLALMLGSRPRSVCGFKGRFFGGKRRECVGGGRCVGGSRSGHAFGSQLRGIRGGSWGLHQC